jgi:hypothetical protein
VTDAEVLHEILRRYVATGRPDRVTPASDALLGVVDEVFPVERADVEGARRLVPRPTCRRATRSTSRSCVAGGSTGS